MSTNRGKKLVGYLFAGIAAAGAYVGAHYLVSGQLPGQPASYRSSPEPFEDLMVSSAADSFLNAPNAEQVGQIRLTLDLVGHSCSGDLVTGPGVEEGNYVYVPVSCDGQAFAYALEREGASTSIIPCAEFSGTVPGICR